MSWLSELVAGVVEGLARVVSSPQPKPWRYGHAFVREDNMCCYCRRFIPGRQQDTSTPCPGPVRKLSPSELGR